MGPVSKSYMYEEGLPNICGNAQIFSHICMRRPLVFMIVQPPFVFWISLNMREIFLSFLSVLPGCT